MLISITIPAISISSFITPHWAPKSQGAVKSQLPEVGIEQIPPVAAIVVEQKYFNLSQPGIEPRSLDLQANTLPHRCKSRHQPQGSRSKLYT